MTKGQVHLMEYVLMTFFVLLVILLITLFLTGWQVSSVGTEQEKIIATKADFLLRAFTNSPYINKNTYKEGSMMEDSKLTTITCEDLQKLYGKYWFAEVEALEFNEPCTGENYPLCGNWSYCKEKKAATIYELPVNIYRKTTGEIDIGILRVGLYN